MLSFFLDLAVIAIPALIGFVQLVFPISQPQRRHRIGVLVGCVMFSVLLYWQQREAKMGHEKEITALPGQVAEAVLKILPTKTEAVQQQQVQPTSQPSIVATAPPQDWGLTEEQLHTLSVRMSWYAPNKKRGDLITCLMTNPDSTKLAFQLAKSFKSAGWRLEGDGINYALFTRPVTGIIIKVRSAKSAPPGLPEFVESMSQAGIRPTGEINEKLPEDEFQIIVGARP